MRDLIFSQERECAASVAATDAQHAELVEKIQQLNLLRESNATLRTDSEAHAKRSRELDGKLKTLLQELDPLRERTRTLQAELDVRSEHVARLEDETRRWQERNSQLLSKVRLFVLLFTYTIGADLTAQYDRVDPAEFQSLKDEIESLRTEKSAWEAQQNKHTEELNEQLEKVIIVRSLAADNLLTFKS
jgi:nucleoprotein TPR